MRLLRCRSRVVLDEPFVEGGHRTSQLDVAAGVDALRRRQSPSTSP